MIDCINMPMRWGDGSISMVRCWVWLGEGWFKNHLARLRRPHLHFLGAYWRGTDPWAEAAEALRVAREKGLADG